MEEYAGPSAVNYRIPAEHDQGCVITFTDAVQQMAAIIIKILFYLYNEFIV